MKTKQEVIQRSIDGMLMSGYKANDTTAMRMISNDVMDAIEKEGRATRKQTNMLSQDVLIKEIKKGMVKKVLGY